MGLSKLVQETKVVEIQGHVFTLKKWPERHRRWKELRAGELYRRVGEGESVRYKLVATSEELQEGLEQDVLNGLSSWSFDEPLEHEAVRTLLDEHGELASNVLDEIEDFNRISPKNSLPSRKP